MMQFQYAAQCEGGATMSGVIEAPDEAEALNELTQMGLRQIQVDKAERPPIRRRIGADDFIFFNEQLASLADSGVCLDVGLRQLAKDIDSARLRRTISQMADDLERGLPLDQALTAHAAQLPGMYSRVVRAGVQSGQLGGTLLNLSNHLRLMSQTRRIIAQTVAYPAVVACVAFAIFCVVLWFVVPQFEQIFADFDTELPLLTQTLIAVSRELPTILTVVGCVVLAGIVLWAVTGRSSLGRSLRERLLLALPLLGRLYRDSVRARLLRAVAFSVNSGLPLPESLRLAADATGSRGAARDADRVATDVEAGRSAMEACRSTVLVPPMFGYVVQVSGDRDNVDHALTQLSQAYASRAVHSQSMIRAWLAPLSIITVGALIGILIVAMFLPLMHLIDSVS